MTLCGGEFARLSDFEHLADYDDKCDRNEKNTQYQEAYKAKGFASYYYWSSTTCSDYTSDALYVEFAYGHQGNWGKNGNFYVRCVRAGQ